MQFQFLGLRFFFVKTRPDGMARTSDLCRGISKCLAQNPGKHVRLARVKLKLFHRCSFSSTAPMALPRRVFMSHAPIVNQSKWKRRSTDGEPVQCTETVELIELPPEWLEAMEAEDVFMHTVQTTRTPLQKLARALKVSKGQASKVVNGYSGTWIKRSIAVMSETKSLLPLHFIAHRLGFEAVFKRRRTNA